MVDDLIKRADELASQRVWWEKAWIDIARYCLPMAERIRSEAMGRPVYDALQTRPESVDRSPRIYDSTSTSAVDRLAAGIESLATPIGQKWHGAAIDDPLAPEPSDEEREWFDRLVDYQFAARYDPKSGFQIANQLAIKTTVALGTGVVFVEEGRPGDTNVPVRYRFIPLSECYLATDHHGVVDTNFRRFALTARQAIQKFGEDRVSQRIRKAAGNPRDSERRFEILHAVMPREEIGSSRAGNRDSAFASFYVEVEERHLIGDSGFFEFPFIVYQWNATEGGAYGESPVMIALADIRMLQAMSRESLAGLQQWIKPPLGVASEGINRLNLNPGAVNPGLIDPSSGRLLAQPITTVQNPSFAEAVLEARRNMVRESLYINLFQILIQNPQMTATEALIRAQEKGELLGPAGARIQMAMAHMFDREFGILERRGAFGPGAALQPPETLEGRSIGIRFTSPLDRLRRASEGVGVQRTLEVALPLAQVDPSVLDNIDPDETLRIIREVHGAPAKMLRTSEEVAQLREQRAQQAAAAQMMAMLQQGAQAAKDGGAAVAGMAKANTEVAAADALA